MSNVIVYQLPGQPVAIMRAMPECGLTTLEVAQKDVPAGVEFWIIDDAELPIDRTYRDAWSLDPVAMGVAAGVGGTYIAPSAE